MKRGFVFPGQGSQAVGMGRRLAEASATAREVYEEVDDALGQKLSSLMFDGPAEELLLTENAQPAIMAASVAVARVMEKDGGVPLQRVASFVAGHSLGEYSALTAAGALKLGDAARLLKLRGRAMQAAVPVGAGAMAALLGPDFDEAQAIAAEAAQGQICQAANDNGPGQVVVSGDRAAVERAVAIAKERGRKAILLNVSAPFHCALLKPAADAMEEALADIEIVPPCVPLVANVTASAVAAPDEIRRLLVEQVTAMVRWRECVLFMVAEGCEEEVELGGKVLSGLVRRIERSLSARAIETPEDIEEFLKTI